MSQDLYQAFMVMINFAALVVAIIALVKKQQLKKAIQWLGRLLSNTKYSERAVFHSTDASCLFLCPLYHRKWKRQIFDSSIFCVFLLAFLLGNE